MVDLDDEADPMASTVMTDAAHGLAELRRQVEVAMPRDPMRPEALEEQAGVTVIRRLSPADLIHVRRAARVVRRGFRG